jgi:hypothetical protein
MLTELMRLPHPIALTALTLAVAFPTVAQTVSADGWTRDCIAVSGDAQVLRGEGGAPPTLDGSVCLALIQNGDLHRMPTDLPVSPAWTLVCSMYEPNGDFASVWSAPTQAGIDESIGLCQELAANGLSVTAFPNGR